MLLDPRAGDGPGFLFLELVGEWNKTETVLGRRKSNILVTYEQATLNLCLKTFLITILFSLITILAGLRTTIFCATWHQLGEGVV